MNNKKKRTLSTFKEPVESMFFKNLPEKVKLISKGYEIVTKSFKFIRLLMSYSKFISFNLINPSGFFFRKCKGGFPK